MPDEQTLACPFGLASLERAKGAFLVNPLWERRYAQAPLGAKRRLEVSFWFSQNRNWVKEHPGDAHDKYRTWRGAVEKAMTDADLEYMIGLTDNPSANKHYVELLERRRAYRAPASGTKLMTYDEFFAMLDAQGDFNSFDYDDETKKGIIDDFLPVLKGSGDPLETYVEDILATAKLKEARVYPKDEIMYVRVEVRFLTETAEWSRPYQMLAAWDCFNDLKGYVFPVGRSRRTELPVELENPQSWAQEKKRVQLLAERVIAANKSRKEKAKPQ